MFFANCVFENVMFLLFLRIYDVIKIIVITSFFVNYIFENDIFLRIHNVINNCDVMFFVNYVFENVMYVLLYHLYQSNY